MCSSLLVSFSVDCVVGELLLVVLCVLCLCLTKLLRNMHSSSDPVLARSRNYTASRCVTSPIVSLSKTTQHLLMLPAPPLPLHCSQLTFFSCGNHR